MLSHSPQPSEEYRVGECTVGPHYDPTGMGPTDRADYDTDCTCDSPGGCEVGDLTGKHDQINVPGKMTSSTASYTGLMGPWGSTVCC